MSAIDLCPAAPERSERWFGLRRIRRLVNSQDDVSRGVWVKYNAWTYVIGAAVLAASLILPYVDLGAVHEQGLLPLRLEAVFIASILPGWLGYEVVARFVKDNERLSVLVAWAIPTVVLGMCSSLAAIVAMRWFDDDNGMNLPLWSITALVVYQAMRRLNVIAWRQKLDAERHARESAEAARALAQGELKMLQAQIEPHFLFNTLASVQHLVDKDPKLAQYLLAQLTRYLRDAIPSARDPSSTLEREFVLVESLLNIVRVRMGGRLTTHIDLPADLRGEPFPPLVVLTLVENAIKHGVEPKPGPVAITVSARRTVVDSRARLEVSVVDDGAGLGGSQTPGSGIGLENIRARLTALYENQARLEIRSVVRGGVAATVCLPLGKS